MLLPSALSCDSARSSHARLQSALFVSPPASPPTLSSQTALGNIVTTCRSLQSLISTPAAAAAAPPPSLAQLPTPPLSHAPPPMKLRLRARPGRSEQAKGDDSLLARRRVVKRSAPPRGANKRRRTDDDVVGKEPLGHDDDLDSDLDIAESRRPQPSDDHPVPPSTPKRARIAPEQIPLGLERADFHHVHLRDAAAAAAAAAGGESHDQPGTDVQVEADGAEWSAEDDRVLVELVLDKLKLSKTDWQDCARSLGMDRHNVNRRWKSLVMKGDVGLKARGGSRRAKLHATWR
ncbi:Uncharacterized protein TCAP_02969 [Tolypocladium capitatum]|uniref:Myb-like domain-containing protein n=1 Tax=Tolypocladium capitatum TaxID=45235 RepID=A0A2K3QHT1_9HYPO|nr:Uncharacterized protein TCAP_02969 [Tolypocladium capitatum]